MPHFLSDTVLSENRKTVLNHELQTRDLLDMLREAKNSEQPLAERIQKIKELLVAEFSGRCRIDKTTRIYRTLRHLIYMQLDAEFLSLLPPEQLNSAATDFLHRASYPRIH